MTSTVITNELKRLSRRIEDIAKTQDLLFKDREILEDILTRLTSLENAMDTQRSTQTENAKNIKADISDVKDAVEAKVDEVTDTMDDKTVILKSPKQGVFEKIISRIRLGGEEHGK